MYIIVDIDNNITNSSGNILAVVTVDNNISINDSEWVETVTGKLYQEVVLIMMPQIVLLKLGIM